MNKRDIQVIRESITKITQMLAGMGLKVTQQGVEAYVKSNSHTLKPEIVNIPMIPDDASEEFIFAIQGFIDHEVAHVLFTDFQYIVEGVRYGEKLSKLHNILEDTMIERKIAKKFPGSPYNLKRLYGFFIEKVTKKMLKSSEISKDEMKRFAVLLVPLMRAMSGQEEFEYFLKTEGHMRDSVIKSFIEQLGSTNIELIPTLDSTADTLDMAKIIHDIMYPDEPPLSEQKQKEKGEKGDKSKSSESSGKSGKGSSGSSGKSKKKEKSEEESEEESGSKKSEGEEENEDEADEAEGDESGENEDEGDEGEGEGEGEDDESGDSEGEGQSDEGDPLSTDYSEAEGDSNGKRSKNEISEGNVAANPFKANTQSTYGFEDTISAELSKIAVDGMNRSDYTVFTTDYDVVKTYDKMEVNGVSAIDDSVRQMVGSMQKHLERMVAQRNVSFKAPGYRRGRMHSSSLHKIFSGDDRVFRKKIEADAKDTAVSLVIDCSGSMSGRKFSTAVISAFALSQTLDRIGIAHECIGFTTCSGYYSNGFSSPKPGYDPQEIHRQAKRHGMQLSRVEALFMPIFKGYDEKLTPSVKARFAHARIHQDFLGNNVDGECVEIAIKRMMPRKEQRKLVIVLSDGSPAAASGRPHDLHNHLKSVIDDYSKLGFEIIGVGIQSDAVQRFYKNYILINKPEELPAAIMGQLSKSLLK